MRTLLLSLAVLLTLSGSAAAQAAASSTLGWDQAAPDVATAQGYTYRLYCDGVPTAGVLTGVQCTGTAAPFLCQLPFPAFTPGQHSCTATAANLAGESLPSTPFPFTFVVIPASPFNLRKTKG